LLNLWDDAAFGVKVLNRMTQDRQVQFGAHWMLTADACVETSPGGALQKCLSDALCSWIGLVYEQSSG
jgi:hypothetical protein